VRLKWKADKICYSPHCGMTFRRVLNLEDDQYISRIAITDAAPISVKPSDMFGPSWPSTSLRRRRGEDHDDADEVSLFRRVRIYNIFHDLVLPDLPCLDLIYRVNAYVLKNNDWFDNGTGFAEIRPGFRVGHLHCFIKKNFRRQTLSQLLTRFTTGTLHICRI